MRFSKESGFTLIELLVVVGIIGVMAVISWQALTGWQERNAVNMVSQNIKNLFERYRQKAVDKGYNYGLILSTGGVHVFEDSGGTGTDRFTKMNNFAIDPGEFSDTSDGINDGVYLVSTDSSHLVFEPYGDPGIILVQTQQSLDVHVARNGSAGSVHGADITSAAVTEVTTSGNPFQAGSMALFFSPDGKVYLKDPTVSVAPLNRYLHELGSNGVDPFYVVRIAYDRMDTVAPDVPYYYEIAVNRYGATSFVRWHSGDGGSNWNAEVQ